jgi:hypothetical protein
MAMADTSQLESLPWELLEKIAEQLPVPDILGLKQVRNDIFDQCAHDIEHFEGKSRLP